MFYRSLNIHYVMVSENGEKSLCFSFCTLAPRTVHYALVDIDKNHKETKHTKYSSIGQSFRGVEMVSRRTSFA